MRFKWPWHKKTITPVNDLTGPEITGMRITARRIAAEKFEGMLNQERDWDLMIENSWRGTLLASRLKKAGLSVNQVALALAAVDSVCHHCWNADAGCQCWNDE